MHACLNVDFVNSIMENQEKSPLLGPRWKQICALKADIHMHVCIGSYEKLGTDRYL